MQEVPTAALRRRAKSAPSIETDGSTIIQGSDWRAARRRILVVDDEPAVRELLKRVLARAMGVAAVEVDTAASADEALARLASVKYSLILSDFRMPGRDGVELVDAARQLQPATPAAIVTAFPEAERVMQAHEEGRVATVIQKPWNIIQLLETVDHLTRYADRSL